MDHNEKAMYTGVTASRNTEVKLRWRRGEIFLLIHSGALSFVFSRPPEKGLMNAMGFLGAVLAGVWIWTNVQTQRWVQYWHSRIDAMERNQEEPVRVQVYAGRSFRRVNLKFPTFHQILMFLSISAFLV